ncbi:ABC transporter ATP-binding protein [Saccharopolyspora sp. NPDC000359]|uniref:ABC transporter ATP-binding protein n=1 Tax=Saccharopolyspora sp. NPDC000359 TaxID=3154251 RepID=UPI00332FCFAB
MSDPGWTQTRLLVSLLRPRAVLSLVALLILLAENAAQLAGPLLIATAIDRGLPAALSGQPAVMVWCVVGYFGCGALSALARYCFFRLSGRIGQDVVMDLRTRIFRHAHVLSVSAHERRGSGSVITRLTSDVHAVNDLIETGLDGLLTSLLSVAAIGFLMLWLDLPLGLVVFAGFVPIALLTRWYRHRSQHAYRTARTTVASIVGHVAETMNTMRVMQACRSERADAAKLGELNGELRRKNTAALDIVARYMSAVRLCGNLSLCVVLALGAWRVMDGSLQLGVLAAFVLYLRRFYDPLDELATFTDRYSTASVALERITEFLRERPEVPEPRAPQDWQPNPAAGAEISLRHVSFRYAADAPEVFDDLTLVVPAGQTVALVGSTGAGKSTLAKLIARFYDPVAGVVAVDGVDLRQVRDADLRKHLIMVPQENFLFTGTVADNIALGRPEAGRAEVEHAARCVGAHEFIAELPSGYDTQVQRGGSRLSAGQRQLVAIARVFLADPAVLVLDEATSQVDLVSEQRVQEALRRLLRDRTAVVIAHRLSTVMSADRVLVLDKGRIVEDTTPEAALTGSGHFADLHRMWERPQL